MLSAVCMAILSQVMLQFIIINFYLPSYVFPEFDFDMKQNMAEVLLLQKMFSCLRDPVFSFSTFFSSLQIEIWFTELVLN